MMIMIGLSGFGFDSVLVRDSRGSGSCSCVTGSVRSESFASETVWVDSANSTQSTESTQQVNSVNSAS
ncbi:hypothetical protein HanIR_Chr10g0478281 [Helianthus annuus]|nr:hypothetical protein HanIR_Chr10g0478281 [Helianthus annuus]